MSALENGNGNDLLHQLGQLGMQELIEAEATEVIGADRWERTVDRHKALRDFMATNHIARRSRSVRLGDEAVSQGYLAGETMQDLATRFGCSVWSISQALERTYTPKRPGKR